MHNRSATPRNYRIKHAPIAPLHTAHREQRCMLMAPSDVSSRWHGHCCTQLSDQTNIPAQPYACWTNRPAVVCTVACMRTASSHRAALQQPLKTHQTIICQWCGDKRSRAHRPPSHPTQTAQTPPPLPGPTPQAHTSGARNTCQRPQPPVAPPPNKPSSLSVCLSGCLRRVLGARQMLSHSTTRPPVTG